MTDSSSPSPSDAYQLEGRLLDTSAFRIVGVAVTSARGPPCPLFARREPR